MNKHPYRLLEIATLLLALAPSSLARNEWFTGRTVNGQTAPLSLEALKNGTPGFSQLPARQAEAAAPAPAGTVLIDLTMSIPDDAAGDDDGKTVDVDPGSAEQDKWERIGRHFARSVYEMTEGQHRIRRLFIFRKGRNAANADIVWRDKGHPHVPANGGVGEPGGRINMFKIFEKGSGATDKDMLADEIGSGYTMGHEFGHYYYGVYDEYAKNAAEVGVNLSIMRSQWNAKGGDNRWLNFSVRNRGGGAAGVPFGEWENTKKTRQHSVMAASCWETISRLPVNDPVVGSLGRRIYYPEVAAFAPVGNNLPVVDLNLAGADPLADFEVIWSEKTLLEIVIDNSGSMAGQPLENAKAAAKLLVDRTEVGETRVGVIVFSSSARVLTPITEITSDAVKQTIKNAIDTINDEGATAIGTAATLALNEVLGAGAESNVRAVFLLSDGQSNTGVNPLSVIPAYQNAQIPLFTFAFGSGADTETLRQMAAQTGGKFYVSPTSLPEITRAFQDAFSIATSTPLLADSSFSAPGSGRETLQKFPVDSGLATLEISVIYDDGDAEVQLVDPQRQRFDPSSTDTVGNQTVASFSIANPQAGTWAVAAKSTTQTGTNLQYLVSGIGEQDSIALSAYSLEGTTIAFPRPVLVRAKLGGERPVAGANALALAYPPFGDPVPVKLADDGIEPDSIAGDGTYSGYYYYSQGGAHDISVQFDNKFRRAKFTSREQIGSPNVNGAEPPPERDAQVPEDFTRSTRFSVSTTGGRFAFPGNLLPQGTYVSTLPGTGTTNSAWFQIAVGRKGSFSGKLAFEGVSYSLRGKFNPNGGWAGNIRRGKLPALRVSLQLDVLNGSDRLYGRLTDGGYSVDISSRRNPFTKSSNAPEEGYYTALLDIDGSPDPALVPTGTGFATVTIDGLGRARIVGRLPDGTVLSSGSAVTGDGLLPIYAGLYARTGSFYGTLARAGNLLQGSLQWNKPASPKDKLYPAGFAATTSATVAIWEPPARGERALAFGNASPNANLSLFAGETGSIPTIAITLDADNRFTIVGANAIKLKLAINVRSGLVSGSFIHPTSKRGVSLLGAGLQTIDSAGGFFLSPAQSGGFDVEPVP